MKSPLARLDQLLWILFLFWTLVEWVLVPFDLGPSQINASVQSAGARNALLYLLSISDAVWVVLAAIVMYLHLIRQEGLAAARRTSAITLLGTGLLGWIGLKTAFPFGPHIFTNRLGACIAGVPFTFPLLWMVILCAARYTVLNFHEHATRLQLALGTGLLALCTDLGLEFVAWKVRGWWIWWFPVANTPSWPPWQNYLTWFVAGTLLAWVAFPAARPVGRQKRPACLLLLVNLLFWTAFVARTWGGF